MELEPGDPHGRLRMPAPTFVVTIARAGELLYEDEELLWDLANGMEPEDGCLWVYGPADQQTLAFTGRGLECLQDLLTEHKRRSPSPRS